METYYHGAPEIQPDGLQTLYLMNPGYLGYSADASLPSTNMVFHNSTANQVNQSQQQFVGVPLQSQPVPVSVPDVTAEQGLLPRVQYSLWNPMQSNNLTSQSSLRRIEDPHMLPAQQGLSLSLNPQQRSYTIHQPPPGLPVISPRGGGGQDHGRLPAAASSGVSIGIAGLQGALMGSKFLKVTQQLLDEVVSVGKGVKEEPERAGKTTGLMMGSQESEEASGGCGSGGGGISEKRPASDLTTAERQDIQMKKAKLLNMLDEVEQRYRQYHQQMQIVISSFEAIAGTGSARTYTALALQTISKQFRCLRDAISGQVRSTNKTLGEEDCQLGRFRSEGGSRLRFVDHQLRQQKALQQLGVMQPHNAWRPQRGLPERSVSVLRAWLFEHFLHPYPKDSDKHMLAKQTGLSRNQVSNWFINARVRLWKPMVEEMYLEEAKEQKKDTNDVNNTRKSEEDSGSKSIAQLMPPAGGCSPELYQIPTTTSKINRIPAAGHHGEDNNEEEMMNKRPKNSLNNLPTGNHHQAPLMHNRISTDVKPLDTTTATTNNIDLFMRFGDNGQGFGSYSIGEISRPFGTAQFLQPPSPSPSPSQQQQQQQYSTNGVSLTLGLQHCDGVPLSGQLPAYLSTTTDANSYTNMNDDENSNVGIMGPPENAYGSFKMTMEALVGRRAYSWHTQSSSSSYFSP